MILPVSKLCLARIRRECRRLDGDGAKSGGLACLVPMRLAAATRILIFLAILILPAHAQVAAAISGTVVDPSGAGVAAKVTVTNEETGAMRRAFSDDSGNFSVQSLVPGPFELK